MLVDNGLIEEIQILVRKKEKKYFLVKKNIWLYLDTT